MRKILSILLIAGLLFSLCACGQQKEEQIYTDPDAGGMIGNGGTITTTPSDTENKTENTGSNNELSMKAEKGSYSLKYPVSESGIKSLLTFYECEAGETYKDKAAKIYRNYAENVIVLDERSYFTPIDFTCEIKDGEYNIKLQYSETDFKEMTYGGNGILIFQITDIGVNYSSSSMMYDMSQLVIINDEDKIATDITLNGENIDFSKRTENTKVNIVKITEENIKQMSTLKTAELNSTYSQMSPNATTYINEAKNVIIIDTRSEKTELKINCVIDKNEDGESIFKLTITGAGKEHITEHKGYGVYKLDLSDAGSISMYVTMYNSTDEFTK